MFGFFWRTLAGKRLLNTSGSFRVWRFQSVEQAIRACLKKLREAGECGQRNGISPALNMTYRLPMYANQFGKAFLRHIGFHSCLADALAK
jgi:hypothetical protein